MNKLKDYKNLFPIILLTAFCLSTIIQFIFINPRYVLNINHFLGIISIVTCLIIFFKWRSKFRIAVITTLILGLVGLLNFTIAIYRFNLGPITLDLVSFLISLLYLVLNIPKLKQKYFGNEQMEILPDPLAIEKFKSKYSYLSDQELEELKNDPRYLVEVKIAVDAILNERQQKPSS